MKEYNRTTKKWEEKSTEVVGVLKKRELCKGQRPHQMKQVMPFYGSNFSGYEFTDEQIEQYYQSKERLQAFEQKEIEFLNSLGIPEKRGWRLGVTRYKRCEVCGKKEY